MPVRAGRPRLLRSLGILGGVWLAASPAAAAGQTSARRQPAALTPDPAGDGAAVRYDARPLRGGAELRVTAFLPPLGSSALVLGEGYAPFVRDLRIDNGSGWKAASLEGDGLPAPSCASATCRIEYRFLLDAAAEGRRRRGGAIGHSGAWLAPPSVWLLRPREVPGETPFELTVGPAGETRFVSGLARAGAGSGDSYRGALATLEDAPYSGLGRFEERRIDVGGGTVDLAIAPGARTLSSEAVAAWVERSAIAVSAYLGRMPVLRVLVIVLPGSGRRPVGYGSTMGNGGASIMISLASSCSEGDLRSDWVLVHEMAHLALPNLQRRHRWIEEGLSTYVEPVMRARSGLAPAEEVWAGLVRGLPKGQPRPGDRGLDQTPSWGSTYWGGALFWLLADLEIRGRSGNRLGLEHALRGILDGGGSIEVSWDLARLLRAGDEATGLDVLRRLHGRMGGSPWGVEFGDLWRRLGVVRIGDAVRLEADAPLAAMRDAITAPRLAPGARPSAGGPSAWAREPRTRTTTASPEPPRRRP